CTLGRSLKDNRYIPASTSYGELWDVAKQYRAAQEQYLRDHNAILESREFTNLLLDHLLPPDSSKENTATTIVHWSDGSGVVESGVDYLVLDKAVTVSAAKGNSWQRLVEEPHINFQIENMSTNRRSLLRIRLAKHDLN